MSTIPTTGGTTPATGGTTPAPTTTSTVVEFDVSTDVLLKALQLPAGTQVLSVRASTNGQLGAVTVRAVVPSATVTTPVVQVTPIVTADATGAPQIATFAQQ